MSTEINSLSLSEFVVEQVSDITYAGFFYRAEAIQYATEAQRCADSCGVVANFRVLTRYDGLVFAAKDEK